MTWLHCMEPLQETKFANRPGGYVEAARRAVTVLGFFWLMGTQKAYLSKGLPLYIPNDFSACPSPLYCQVPVQSTILFYYMGRHVNMRRGERLADRRGNCVAASRYFRRWRWTSGPEISNHGSSTLNSVDTLKLIPALHTMASEMALWVPTRRGVLPPSAASKPPRKQIIHVLLSRH